MPKLSEIHDSLNCLDLLTGLLIGLLRAPYRVNLWSVGLE